MTNLFLVRFHMKFLVILLCIGAALAHPLLSTTLDASYSSFEAYKSKWNKTYENAEEESRRYDAFRLNILDMNVRNADRTHESVFYSQSPFFVFFFCVCVC